MTHRGPTTAAPIVAPGVALGVRRLSIVDVEGGHQPFANEDGTIWAAQNGELYNHAERPRADLRRPRPPLREPLRHGDPAAPLRGATGTAFPEQLRGMFALAVWDASGGARVVARDRLGIKPLYYADCGDLLVFGSELKSLLASGLVGDRARLRGDRRLPHASVLPGAADAARGRAQARAGHRCSSIDDGSVEQRALLGVPRSRRPSAVGEPRGDGASALLDELDESVRLRLMSDVPLGAMLSGGLDSSLIVALMARTWIEPGQDVLGRLRARPARATSSPTRGCVAEHARRRPPRARALVRRGDGRPRRARLAPRRAARRPLVARLPRALASSRRSTSRSRSPARAPTSSSAATASTAPPRSPDAWQRLPAPVRRAALARGSRAAPRGCAGRSARSRRRPGRAAASR